MDKYHQTLLESHYSQLVREMEPGKMLDCMRESPLFGLRCEHVEKAINGRTTAEKARLIIEALLRKGPSAFAFFVEALYKTSVSKDLAEKLAREGGVSLDTVRKQHAKEIAGVNFGLTRVVQPGLETVQMSILQSAPLPFQPLPMEDEMTLHHRKDIFGERATIRALPVMECEHGIGQAQMVFGTRSFTLKSAKQM